MVLVEYSKELQFRDFGIMNAGMTKPMAQEFDCKVTHSRSMFDLDEIATLNF